jgi:hypothetical protein
MSTLKKPCAYIFTKARPEFQRHNNVALAFSNIMARSTGYLGAQESDQRVPAARLIIGASGASIEDHAVFENDRN